MADTPKLPTPAEQQATYRAAKALYDKRYAAWFEGGKVGNPPPRPIPPHTPGRVSVSAPPE